ncbi:hypothetical protein BDL97_10G016000 [Sphagnum fallax]|nr:hypothetical protein BDL97_10G016000 [Sphagnum fallax]
MIWGLFTRCWRSSLALFLLYHRIIAEERDLTIQIMQRTLDCFANVLIQGPTTLNLICEHLIG